MSFQVLWTWKGVAVNDGDSMLVYASSSNGALSMTICTRTTPSLYAQDDFTALGPPLEMGTASPGTLGAMSSGCSVGSSGASEASWTSRLMLLLALARVSARRRS